MKVELYAVINKLNEVIEMAHELERSREASIAITNLETAELWLLKLEEYGE